MTIVTGKAEDVQLTIHGDHLWYDDLQSVNAKVRGEAITGADANDDGVITQAELAAVSLTTLPLGQYGTGGASNVKNLDDFVRALSRTVGHFRGEGEARQPRGDLTHQLPLRCFNGATASISSSPGVVEAVLLSHVEFDARWMRRDQAT